MREHAQSPVAGLVPVLVVELLEAVEVGYREREGASLSEQPAELALEHPPVDEPGEAVGRGLQLCPLERTHGSDARAGLRCERGELCDLLRVERLSLGPRGMEDS